MNISIFRIESDRTNHAHLGFVGGIVRRWGPQDAEYLEQLEAVRTERMNSAVSTAETCIVEARAIDAELRTASSSTRPTLFNKKARKVQEAVKAIIGWYVRVWCEMVFSAICDCI